MFLLWNLAGLSSNWAAVACYNGQEICAMRVLIVASYNTNRFAPFIIEQADVLKNKGCEVFFFGLQGKGLLGYLKNLTSLKEKIKMVHPDVIHAHYGLSGLLANLQRKVPVITTYHGSDINYRWLLPFSFLSMKLSAWNIFVSDAIMKIARARKKSSVIPCGVNLDSIQLTSRRDARDRMHLSADIPYILFSGAFDCEEKNPSLAKKVVELTGIPGIELIELKGYSREEVTFLFCAVNALLMTSFSEGSPQVIKEAMACGCPIVSVDVGDVKERIVDLEGCFVVNSYNPAVLAEYLAKAGVFVGKTKGRERIIDDKLDNNSIANAIIGIYRQVLSTH